MAVAMMRLSCLSLSYQKQFRSGSMDLPKFITTARGLGFDGVDLHMQHLKSFDRIYLKQLRRLCADNGMSVPSFPVSSEFGQFPERIGAEIEKCRVGMETGLFLGAPLVRLFVGSTPKGGNAEEAFKRGADALRKCAEIGEDMGMLVALQNHSGLTSTGDDMLRFHKAVNHPNFALVLDTGHFTGRTGPNGPKIEGHTYEHYYRSLQQVAPLAPFVRVKLYEVNEQGAEKHIDYPRVFEILRGVHYNGFCSLVYEGTEDELTAIPRGARYLRKMVRGD
ncbi:MAG: sugar phosphate isomerase/epimerase [Acidobacteria bacterium]|nr:sugar phosphate isomerase/epimerase [Acidobacteriota bacterium]MBM3768145.1 sugar phosphate isomerase/epimerase [Acidobacteriota bacterium]